jgi:uncharacterized phage protein (TIGR01671 family)
MRDIKYRGKRVSDGKWVYGYLCRLDIAGKDEKGIIYTGTALIYSQEDELSYSVLNYSIEQYIGKQDKCNNDIYGGDILSIRDYYTDIVLDDGTGPTEEYFHLAPVVFQDACYGVMIQDEGGELRKGFWSFPEVEKYLGSIDIKIVGNIWDNPELIVEAKQ